MKYDPIKARLGRIFNKHPFLRKTFYTLLDLLLLRTWHVHYHLREFFRFNPENRDIHVLDAGFGFGQYTWYMARKKPQWNIDGIELKQEQVEDCTRFFAQTNTQNVHFFTGDLTSFKKPDKYNLILSVDVMEHIENDVQVFENFYESLKSEGLLMISTPSDQGGSGVVHDHDESFIEEHVRDGYSRNEIREKLKKAGFTDVEILYTYGQPGSLSWKLSMKYPILLLGKTSIFYLFLPFYYMLVFPFCLALNYADVHIMHSKGTGLLVKARKLKQH
jgi:2-polyprenyl-3-methyl-5-hydroxy-6-metoxy-1,4-benzoquinol methylase